MKTKLIYFIYFFALSWQLTFAVQPVIMWILIKIKKKKILYYSNKNLKGKT